MYVSGLGRKHVNGAQKQDMHAAHKGTGQRIEEASKFVFGISSSTGAEEGEDRQDLDCGFAARRIHGFQTIEGVNVEVTELAAGIAKLCFQHRVQPLTARAWAHVRRRTASGRRPAAWRRPATWTVRSRRAMRIWAHMVARGPAPSVRRMPVRWCVVMCISRALVLVRRRTRARRPRIIGRTTAVWGVVVHAGWASSHRAPVHVPRRTMRRALEWAAALRMVGRGAVVIGRGRALLRVRHVAFRASPVVSPRSVASVRPLPPVLSTFLTAIALRVRRSCAPTPVLRRSAVGRAMRGAWCGPVRMRCTMSVHIPALAVCSCNTSLSRLRALALCVRMH